MSKFAQFCNMYRYMRFNRVRITFMPYQGYNASGLMSIALDPNPRAVSPTAITETTRHRINATGDIKSQLVLDILAKDLHQGQSERSAWLITQPSSAVAEPEWYIGGVIQAWSQNAIADAATIGTLRIDVDASFKALTAN